MNSTEVGLAATTSDYVANLHYVTPTDSENWIWAQAHGAFDDEPLMYA